MIKAIIAVVAIAIVAIVGFLVIDPNINNTVSTTIEYVSENYFQATVEGEVYREGTYTLKEGALMSDLIDAAGGINDNADSNAYYLEAELKTGMTYYIASKYDESDLCNDKEISKVNINTDNAEVLATVNGISASVANSIVSHRAQNGYFHTLEDLLDVYGIGNATYNKIRNYVILHS